MKKSRKNQGSKKKRRYKEYLERVEKRKQNQMIIDTSGSIEDAAKSLGIKLK